MTYAEAGILYLIAINIVTFIIFGWDKFKAKSGGWRVPEKTLLAFAAAGGSIGALIGMKVFRHKTRKAKFTVLVPMILAAQCVGILMIVRF